MRSRRNETCKPLMLDTAPPTAMLLINVANIHAMLTNVTMNERMSRCIPIAWITPKRSGTSKEKCITSSVSVSALWKLRIPKKVIMLLAYSIRRKPMIKGVRY